VTAQVDVTVYDAARRYPTEPAARGGCLAALVEDLAAAGGDTRLVIEQDDSLMRAPTAMSSTDSSGRPSCATRSTTTATGVRTVTASAARRCGVVLGPLRGMASAHHPILSAVPTV